jgi:hypothetical protein
VPLSLTIFSFTPVRQSLYKNASKIKKILIIKKIIITTEAKTFDITSLGSKIEKVASFISSSLEIY